MMRISDEDMGLLARLESGVTGRLFATERTALRDALDEIEALRKVADAAREYADELRPPGVDDDGNMDRASALYDALREAGR